MNEKKDVSLKNFFNMILENKQGILNCQTGFDFEKNICFYLNETGFTQRFQNDLETLDTFLLENKQTFQKKNGSTLMANLTKFKNIFVHQPYKQNVPDFIIFTEQYIYTIECKYSSKTATSPIWNNNLPKADCIYIYGTSGLEDLTFFRGKDILPDEERELLMKFYDFIKAEEEYKNNYKNVVEGKYGFVPSIRACFRQRKTMNQDAIINFYKNPERDILEENVKKFTTNL